MTLIQGYAEATIWGRLLYKPQLLIGHLRDRISVVAILIYSYDYVMYIVVWFPFESESL